MEEDSRESKRIKWYWDKLQNEDADSCFYAVIQMEVSIYTVQISNVIFSVLYSQNGLIRVLLYCQHWIMLTIAEKKSLQNNYVHNM